jgi:acyl-CoA dehydrogenase
MDFALGSEAQEWRRHVSAFMDAHVYPAEKEAHDQAAASGNYYSDPEIVVELRKKAKAEGLWNLFLPDNRYGKGLNNVEYAPLAEIMGRSVIGARVFNCAAPDTGNMEILAEFGTEEQKRRWLIPALEGEIRTCFSMTEPETAGSDPTQLRTRAVRDGDYYVINGHKWFTTGAFGAACAIVWRSPTPTLRRISARARSSCRSIRRA